MQPVYEPREDSELLASCLRNYEGKLHRVLDMGTGSGFLAGIIAERADEVVAADLNPAAVAYASSHHPLPNVRYVHTDLFAQIEGSFDLIIFNSPYLPSEEGLVDMALDGGVEGWEVNARFLKQAHGHLRTNGVILLLFSSLTNKEKMDDIIHEEGYSAKCIASAKLFFEELYVYEIRATC